MSVPDGEAWGGGAVGQERGDSSRPPSPELSHDRSISSLQGPAGERGEQGPAGSPGFQVRPHAVRVLEEGHEEHLFQILIPRFPPPFPTYRVSLALLVLLVKQANPVNR